MSTTYLVFIDFWSYLFLPFIWLNLSSSAMLRLHVAQTDCSQHWQYMLCWPQFDEHFEYESYILPTVALPLIWPFKKILFYYRMHLWDLIAQWFQPATLVIYAILIAAVEKRYYSWELPLYPINMHCRYLSLMFWSCFF